MNYRKLLNDHLDRNTDKTPVLVALFAGLAVGAALGVLFAPGSGSETRDLIADKSKDLTDSAKEKLNSYKDKIKNSADHLADTAKDKYQGYKERAQDTVEDLKNAKDNAVDHVKSAAKDLKNDASDAKDAVKNA